MCSATRGHVMRRIHVIGIGAGDPDYVTAQAVAALNDTAGLLRDGQGRREGRPGGAAARDLRAVHPRTRLPLRRAARPAARQGRRLPAGRRRLARRPRRRVGATRFDDELARRRRRRLPGVGRPVAVRQHAAHPRHASPQRVDFDLRRHPRHHRDPGAHRATSHPAQRHRRTGAHHHRPPAARGRAVRRGGGDARRRLRIPRRARRTTQIWWGAYLGTPDELLVAGHRRRGRRADRRRCAPRPATRHGWIMDTYLLRS